SVGTSAAGRRPAGAFDPPLNRSLPGEAIIRAVAYRIVAAIRLAPIVIAANIRIEVHGAAVTSVPGAGRPVLMRPTRVVIAVMELTAVLQVVVFGVTVLGAVIPTETAGAIAGM